MPAGNSYIVFSIQYADPRQGEGLSTQRGGEAKINLYITHLKRIVGATAFSTSFVGSFLSRKKNKKIFKKQYLLKHIPPEHKMGRKKIAGEPRSVEMPGAGLRKSMAANGFLKGPQKRGVKKFSLYSVKQRKLPGFLLQYFISLPKNGTQVTGFRRCSCSWTMKILAFFLEP